MEVCGGGVVVCGGVWRWCSGTGELTVLTAVPGVEDLLKRQRSRARLSSLHPHLRQPEERPLWSYFPSDRAFD